MSRPLWPATLPMLALLSMTVPAAAQDAAAGAKLYAAHCASCHGADRAGMAPVFPALTEVGKRLDRAQIKDRIGKGGGLMPPFAQLPDQDVQDIIAFLEK